MVGWQRCSEGIRPRRNKWPEARLQVEGNGQIVSRDIRRSDEVKTYSTGRRKLRIGPQLPAKVYVSRIQRLTIRPLQTGAQVEFPDGEIAVNAAVGGRWNLSHQTGMQGTVGISIEKRRINGLFDHTRKCF